jgi:hypothetical protein
LATAPLASWTTRTITVPDAIVTFEPKVSGWICS